VVDDFIDRCLDEPRLYANPKVSTLTSRITGGLQVAAAIIVFGPSDRSLLMHSAEPPFFQLPSYKQAADPDNDQR
jgi:hypothetical protein